MMMIRMKKKMMILITMRIRERTREEKVIKIKTIRGKITATEIIMTTETATMAEITKTKRMMTMIILIHCWNFQEIHH